MDYWIRKIAEGAAYLGSLAAKLRYVRDRLCDEIDAARRECRNYYAGWSRELYEAYEHVEKALRLLEQRAEAERQELHKALLEDCARSREQQLLEEARRLLEEARKEAG